MDNERIADIVAEMRRAYKHDGVTGSVIVPKFLMLEFADRIEAAHRREIHAEYINTVSDMQKIVHVGNAARLREALEPMPSLLEWLVVNAMPLGIEDMVPKLRERLKLAKDALDAPQRNCDRFAMEHAAYAAHKAWCEARQPHCNPGRDLSCQECADCFAQWLFDPATPEKGGRP